MVPYAHKENQWIGYEDEESLKIKMDFIKDNGYGGAAVRSIDLDDLHNLCGRGSHSMLRVIYDNLNDYRVPARHTSEPQSTTIESSTSSEMDQAEVGEIEPEGTKTVQVRNIVPAIAPLITKPNDKSFIDCSMETFWPHAKCELVRHFYCFVFTNKKCMAHGANIRLLNS